MFLQKDRTITRIPGQPEGTITTATVARVHTAPQTSKRKRRVATTTAFDDAVPESIISSKMYLDLDDSIHLDIN